MSSVNQATKDKKLSDKEKAQAGKQNHKDLLIEMGLEELPPKNLAEEFADVFKAGLEKALKNANLSFSDIETFISPRRLAAIVKDLISTQPEQTILRKGPAKAAAFDSQGKPTQAALGFVAACQTTLEKVGFQETERGSFLVFEQIIQGQATESLIPKVLKDVLQDMPLNKRMRWGDRQDVFVRPVHWLVLIFGNKVIPAEIFGIQSSDSTIGHRFHHPKGIKLTKPSDYEGVLNDKGYVIADYAKRKAEIENQLQETVKKLAKEKKVKAIPYLESWLLDQVTGLVEWPVVLLGSFDKSFLELPEEALISSMQVHQKCFPISEVLDNGQVRLLPYFLIVSNIESKDPKTVIQGNERVMHARLHDAAFYYKEDKKIPLQDRQEHLKQVVFQHGLGSLWDKSQRIAQLSEFIANQLGMKETKAFRRAAELCKTDLSTQMVLEFPELQGIMGRNYYIKHLQENPNNSSINKSIDSEIIGDAIEGHYHPRNAQDSLPDSFLGAVIAIADRIDSLVGLFALGKNPTGDKDPFALRRQALAILRIILEGDDAIIKAKQHHERDSRGTEKSFWLNSIDLQPLIHKAYEIYASDKEKYSRLIPQQELEKILMDFFYERLRAWYHEKGFSARAFDAVLAVNLSRKPQPLDFHYRLEAVKKFQEERKQEAESLSAANKRVRNILEKSPMEQTGAKTGAKTGANAEAKTEINIKEAAEFSNATKIVIDEKLLQEPAEKQLAEKLASQEKKIGECPMSQYTDALLSLAELKEPVDHFFDTVMVMVEDKALRENRLNLLRRLRSLFLKIADISVL